MYRMLVQIFLHSFITAAAYVFLCMLHNLFKHLFFSKHLNCFCSFIQIILTHTTPYTSLVCLHFFSLGYILEILVKARTTTLNDSRRHHSHRDLWVGGPWNCVVHSLQLHNPHFECYFTLPLAMYQMMF